MTNNINSTIKNIKTTNEQMLHHYQTQMTNAQKHLTRNWNLLKENNNLTMMQIREIVAQIEKDAQHLGECKILAEVWQQTKDKQEKNSGWLGTKPNQKETDFYLSGKEWVEAKK